MTIPTTEIENLPPAAAVLAAMFLAVQAEGGAAQRASVQELFENALALGLADARIASVAATEVSGETIRDAIAAALVSGAGISISVNDAGDTITINAQSTVTALAGAANDMLAAHNGKYLRFTHATAKTFNVQDEASEPLPAHFETHIRNVGAENLTITADVGVTIHAPVGGTLVIEPGGTVTLKRAAADEFDVIGVTVPA